MSFQSSSFKNRNAAKSISFSTLPMFGGGFFDLPSSTFSIQNGLSILRQSLGIKIYQAWSFCWRKLILLNDLVHLPTQAPYKAHWPVLLSSCTYLDLLQPIFFYKQTPQDKIWPIRMSFPIVKVDISPFKNL